MDFSQITKYLDSLYDTYDIPQTDCAVWQDHKPLYRHIIGWADHEKSVKLTANHTYFVYSVSKMFTVTAVMQLVEQGVLSLDGKLEQYIPEYRDILVNTPNGPIPTHRSITIHDLLTMSAGIPGNLSGPNVMKMIAQKRAEGSEADTLDIVRASAADGLIFQPGSHFQYTSCHDVLAGVIQAVTGLRYSAYIQKHIADPLGMTATGVISDPSLLEHMADQYWYRDGKSQPHSKTNFALLTPNHENGGAAIISSVDDCIRLADALACGGIGVTGNRILREETIAQIRTPRLTGTCKADFDAIRKIGYNYGLGVRTLVDQQAGPSRSPLGEFGWDGAAGAYFLCDSTNRISIYLAHHTVGLTPGDEIHYRVRDMVYEALA